MARTKQTNRIYPYLPTKDDSYPRWFPDDESPSCYGFRHSTVSIANSTGHLATNENNQNLLNGIRVCGSYISDDRDEEDNDTANNSDPDYNCDNDDSDYGVGENQRVRRWNSTWM